MLQPLDLFVALKLAVSKKEATYAELASEMGLSPSQVYRAVQSCKKSGLVWERKTGIDRKALLELVSHAARFVYPVQVGPVTRGTPTAYSAAPLKDDISNSSSPLVWPDPKGVTRGESVEPLHKRASFAAQNDAKFYEVLALVDALRVGRTRERQLAQKYLRERLSDYAD